MKKWSLNVKLMAIMAALSIGAMMISFFGITGMLELSQAQKTMLAREVKADSITFLMTDQQRLITILTRDIIIEREEAVMDTLIVKSEEAQREMFRLLEDYRLLASDDGKKMADQYKLVAQKWLKIIDEIIVLAKQNRDDDVRTILNTTARAVRNELQEITDRINAETAKEVDNSIRSSEERAASVKRSIVLISVLSIGLGILIGIIVLRSLSKTINYIISTLSENSNQVADAANQISSSSQGLSEATTEQASSLEQTSSSIAEMSSMVLKTSDNAGRSKELSIKSLENVTTGKKVVEEMIAAIDGITHSNRTIQEQIEDSNKQISDIVRVIAEIENRTKVINDIVFQTKLLSFNASVEAARAGEHGKGFAVVAEEVGSLAEMSGRAAKEISDLLESSIHKVESIVDDTKVKVEHLMIASKDKIEHGTKIAKQCGEVLDSIVRNVSDVNTMVNEIADACREQSMGVQEITKAVSQLDQVTQQNAATSEQTASSSEELAQQAETLKNIVQLLTQTIRGYSEEPARVASTLASNVIPIRKSKKTIRPNPQQASTKRAVGMVENAPSSEDSRFEDV